MNKKTSNLIKKFLIILFILIVLFFMVSFFVGNKIYNKYIANKTYLIALMNTDEKKPDGGFFGSYAILRGTGNFVSIDFFDSYYPQTIKEFRTPLPNWFQNVIGIEDIGFLGVNMLGFTDLDGENIQKIYYQTFKEKLDGVIFLKSSLFQFLDKDFRKFFRKHEFQNASIDLIKAKQNKKRNSPKEFYFKDINHLVKSFKLKKLILKSVFQIRTLLDKGFVRVYLNKNTFPDDNIFQILKENNLTNLQTPSKICSFDYNLGFNKIDGFIKKELKIFSGSQLIFFTDKDILNLEKNIKSGIFSKGIDYKLEILYKLSIPEEYFEYISSLQKQFDIELGEREKTILSINPQFHTKGVVYFPTNFEYKNIDGDLIFSKKFNTNFGEGVVFDIAGNGKKLQKKVYITFQLK